MVNRPDTINFDFVVVGAGSSGSVLVSRLVRRGLKVLLIEAGTGDPTKHYRGPGKWLEAALSGDALSEAFHTEKQPGMNNRWIPVYRGRGVGGCSNINATLYSRGRREDYDHHWPWDVSDVEGSFKSIELELNVETRRSTGVLGPSFERMVEQAGTSRTTTTAAAAGPARESTKIGAATAPAPSEEDDEPTWTPLGLTSTWHTTTSGGGASRVTAWATFVKPVMAMPNLKVMDNASVTRLLVENERVVGIELIERARGMAIRGRLRQFRFASVSTEVVLCSGVFKTPQILMLSGIGPRQHLEEKKIPVVVDSPHVGSNLHDHLILNAVFLPRKSVSEESYTTDGIHGHVVIPFAKSDLTVEGSSADIDGTASSSKAVASVDAVVSGSGTSTPLGGSDPVEATASDLPMGGFLFWDGGFFSRNLSALVMMALMKPGLVMALLRFFFSVFGWLLVGFTPARSIIRRIRAISTMVTTIKSRGTVRLKSSDPRTPPLVDPGYLTHPDDVRLVCGAWRRLRRVMRDTEEGKAVIGTEIVPGLRYNHANEEKDILAFVRDNCQSYHHPVGTCRMGRSAEDSVISSETMRVFGVQGLRVADASAAPLIPSTPTQGMAMMIGERAAAIILKDTLSKERIRAAMIEEAGKSIN